MQVVAPGLGVDVSAINMRDATEIERGVAALVAPWLRTAMLATG